MSDQFWTETGTGRPLVLLHGGFLDHRMWDDQVPAFADRYRVIAPDARGHGRSANATAPFRHADDLAALLRRLGTGPAVLVGVSMGAATAVDTALEHPDLVAAVVVSGAGTSEPHFEDPWTTAVLAEWTGAMAAGETDAAAVAFTRFAAGPHRRLDDLDPEVVHRLMTMTKETFAKHSLGEPDWSVPVPDTWIRAERITVPVHAVNGAADSPDHLAMAERLVRIVGTGTVTAIDDAAHYPNLERSEAFNAVLERLLPIL
ncbi:alpha/beta hydrolase [Glycomyces sp. A-F 0318]|uniref:alpha/beta fold hydrolase n=1 Tax=Glycomyces amatae TaxID=2881355 RepID=UPI001E5471F9|nr:alpha/beta hydrolase [Glycomyces amatae]MCD0447266.1 alpha/beta hydrolase [Glycomyces amatae]